MRRIRRVTEKVWITYKMRGFWGFVKDASIYLLRRYPILSVVRRIRFCFLPYPEGIKLYKRKTAKGQIKVLYGDTISEPQAKSNVNSIIRAYRKVSTLVTFDYRKLARQYGRFRMNEMLVQTAVGFMPDLIHLGKSELIHGSTIKKIKQEMNTCAIHFCGDSQGKIQPWVIDIGKYADYNLFCRKDASLIKQYEDLGVRNTGLWWAHRTWDLKIAEMIEKVAKYQVKSGIRRPTLKHRQGINSKVTPNLVRYNLNFDDLLPCYSDFTLLERLVQLFPEIKITIFMPINNRDWGNKNILDYPKWCRKIAQLPSANFEIALHGYYHCLNDRVETPEFKYLLKEEAIDLLLRCEDAFKRARIKFIRGFRPPRWEMSKGTEQALEELDYLFLSDSPRFYEEHQDIRVPRIFPNSDIKDNEEYIEVKPYKHLLLDSREFYIHRGHLVSHADNNLTKDTFDNVVKTIVSFSNVKFKFLSEIALDLFSTKGI